MTARKTQGDAARPTRVTVAVEPENAPRLVIGSRWQVVSSSLDSLWQGRHTVRLELVADGEETGGPE